MSNQNAIFIQQQYSRTTGWLNNLDLIWNSAGQTVSDRLIQLHDIIVIHRYGRNYWTDSHITNTSTMIVSWQAQSTICRLKYTCNTLYWTNAAKHEAKCRRVFKRFTLHQVRKGATLFSTITLAYFSRFLKFLYHWKQEWIRHNQM